VKLLLIILCFQSYYGFSVLSKDRTPLVERSLVRESCEVNLRWVLEEELEYQLVQGQKGVFSIEIKQYGMTRDWDKIVSIKVSKRTYQRFDLSQAISFKKDAMNGLFPEISDFNNDGMLDLKIRTYEAARGANEVCTLFIFDPSGDSLITIKNSWQYPNLRYNAELNCVDAWAVYGGSKSEFLKIQGDSLVIEACVEVSEGELIVQSYDHSEKVYKTIRKPSKLAELSRFSNYRPVELMSSIDHPSTW
jgi:hypothetical protein